MVVASLHEVARRVGQAVDERDQAGGAGDARRGRRAAAPALGLGEEARREERRRRRPIGTLMKKVQRQSTSVRAPPRMRPMAAPAPDIAAYTPMARLRAWPAGKVVVIRARAVGEASAAPTPCRARAASSIASFWARPPSSEAQREERRRRSMNIRAPTEQVTEAAAEQQQAAEGERVGGDDPRQVAPG